MTLWARWVRFMDRRETATALAVCRIVVGLAVATHLLQAMWVGGDQLFWVDAAYGGLRDLDGGWLERAGGLTPGGMRAFTAATTLFALMFAAGLYTRVSAVLTWVGFRTLADLNSHSGGAYDELLKNELFILVLSGCGGALSLDALRAGVRATIPAWPRYVLAFQLVLMYWATGAQKVSEGWVPGGSADALWYILQQPTWHRVDMGWAAPLYPLTQLASVGTWFFEVGSPLLLLTLWYRHTRTRPGRLRALTNRLDARSLYLLAGLGMHVGIEAAMEVGAFTAASLALYVCFFHPDELEALWRRLRPGQPPATAG